MTRRLQSRDQKNIIKSQAPRKAGTALAGNDPEAEIAQRFLALEAALAPLSSNARDALDRLKVSCAEQAAALDLSLAHPSAPVPLHRQGDLFRRLPVPVLQVTHGLRIIDWNTAARDFFGDLANGNRSGLLRGALSLKDIGPLTRELDAALILANGLRGPDAPHSEPLRLRLLNLSGRKIPFRVFVLGSPPQRLDEKARWWLLLFPESAEEQGAFPDLLRFLVESTSDPISLTDVEGRVMIANRAFARPFDLPLSAIEGQGRESFMPRSQAAHLAEIEARVIAKRTPITMDEPLPGRDGDAESGAPPGRRRHLLTERRPMFDGSGEVIGVFTRVRDVTEELRVREVERLADRVFEQSSDAIILTDPSLRVVQVNPAFLQMSGLSPDRPTELRLDTLLSLQKRTIWQGGSGRDTWLHSALSRSGNWQGEVVLRGIDAKALTCWARIARLSDETGTDLGYVAMLADLTLLRQTQADNQRMAQFDLLTGLANRRLLADRIDDWIGFSSRSGHPFALMYLDLNKFKSVNDSLGHETGDILLTVIADRLRAALDEWELAARIGGDEFVVLMGNADEAAALRRAHSLLERISQPLDLPGLHRYRPGASAGIACYGLHGDSRDALLRNSDLAMFAAKSARKPVVVYEPSMGAEALRELEMRVALLNAIENEEFELHFQPIFDLATQKIRGCEALVRWNRPGHGQVMPGEFLTVAAKAGLMPALDRWVLRRAVAVQARWRWAGLVHTDWTLSINQTASSLAAHDWAEVLDAALSEVGWATRDEMAPPFGLQIELTEDQLAVDVPGAMAALRQLQQLGVALAIDDFGTGYSSLTYLRRMPVTTLKIDASFVRGIEADGDARQIVEAIIGLAKKFGYVTLAEGIESEAALATLRALECDFGQGYLFSRPVPLDTFEERFLFGQHLQTPPN